MRREFELSGAALSNDPADARMGMDDDVGVGCDKEMCLRRVDLRQQEITPRDLPGGRREAVPAHEWQKPLETHIAQAIGR